MAKFKPLNENQLVMLPISLQDQIVPGTLEHTISRVVDEHVDLSVFDVRYNNMEIVRSGTQYRENPHFWGHPVASSR